MLTQYRAATGGLSLRLCCLVLGAFAVATGSTAALAQASSTPSWYHVFIVKVKSDRIADFEALSRQMSVATAAAGMPMADVLEVVAGDGLTYHIAIPMAAMGENDAPRPPMKPADMDLWQRRISSTVDEITSIYVRPVVIQGAAAGVAGATSTTPPALIMLRRIKVVSGKEGQFLDWLNKDLQPALNKANMTTEIARGAFGDSSSHFYFLSPIAKWADFDKPSPLEQSLGEQGMEKLLVKLDGVVAEQDVVLLRPRPDLNQ